MSAGRPQLVEGIDYYMEGENLVFTELYHLKRGHCCNSRCRHCPYGLAPDGPPEPPMRIVVKPSGPGRKE